MQSLKELIMEDTLFDWSMIGYQTANKEENLFKQLAINLCGRNYDEIENHVRDFFNKLQKDKNVTKVPNLPGRGPKGKFAIGIFTGDDADHGGPYVHLFFKYNRRVLEIYQSTLALKRGAKWPGYNWIGRGGNVNYWADCQEILSIDENSHLIDEMKEFAVNIGTIEEWIKTFN